MADDPNDLSAQINDLANTILEELADEGEPSRSEGACGTASRLLVRLRDERDAARDFAVTLEGELAELTHAAGVLLDQAGCAADADDRVPVRREALERVATLLREIHGDDDDPAEAATLASSAPSAL